jgi:hypothetical protein
LARLEEEREGLFWADHDDASFVEPDALEHEL